MDRNLNLELADAQTAVTAAENKVNLIKRKIEAQGKKIQEQLYIGPHVPCKAAILKDGRIAVHIDAIYMKGTQATRLFIVEPTEIKE